MWCTTPGGPARGPPQGSAQGWWPRASQCVPRVGAVCGTLGGFVLPRKSILIRNFAELPVKNRTNKDYLNINQPSE